jgi:transcriptional regulator with XRE-family HTH domain
MNDDDSKRKQIASRLRAAREMAGLSQAQVAKILGLHRPSVSEIEAGRRRVSGEELAKLAEVYSVDLDWLMNGEPTGASSINDRAQLAAREFAKLRPEDLDRVLELLKAIRPPRGQ